MPSKENHGHFCLPEAVRTEGLHRFVGLIERSFGPLERNYGGFDF